MCLKDQCPRYLKALRRGECCTWPGERAAGSRRGVLSKNGQDSDVEMPRMPHGEVEASDEPEVELTSTSLRKHL